MKAWGHFGLLAWLLVVVVTVGPSVSEAALPQPRAVLPSKYKPRRHAGDGAQQSLARNHKRPISRKEHALDRLQTALQIMGGGGGDAPDIDKSTTWSLSELTSMDYVYLAIHVCFLAFVVIMCRTVSRTGGEAPAWVFGSLANPYATVGMHLTYFVLGLGLLPTLLPPGLSRLVFSPPTVTLLGYVWPAVESIRATVTEGGTDDRTWLMYWVVQGIFQYSTEFIDQLALRSKFIYKYWHTLEVLVILWLVSPITDGSTLIYQNVAKPYLLPLVTPIKTYCDGWISTLAMTSINAGYLWWFSFIFMSLPVLIKRYAVIGVGSIFPVVATMMALATPSKESKEAMRWLTYWPCFSFVFLIMIAVEKFVGSFKGLYVMCLASTLYLMLPMFNGSTTLFRHVLVPLLGQRELLLLRDARQLAADLFKHVPQDRVDHARHTAAKAFLDDDVPPPAAE
mmetsp:Transcript_9189/g.17492  ORF Transcript_9189/g.17492 Transcript_9189/m.17492 type:complete len:452 (-) Transcript_9189:44-1399(-)